MTEGATATDRRRHLALLLVVTVLVVVADQVTKSLAVDHLSHGPVHLVGPLEFRLEYNSGVAFSLGRGLTGPIVIVVVVLIGAVALLARRVQSYPAAAAVGAVLGGALSNLGDRLLRSHHGAVVDFLYTRYWPTFNVADASVVCGCAVLAWTLWRAPADRHGTGGSPVEPEGGGS